MKKYQTFLSENFQFLEVKFSIYLNRHVFVMVIVILPYLYTCAHEIVSPQASFAPRK